METPVKRMSHFLKDLVTYVDYVIFRLLRLFDSPPIPGNVRRILLVERLSFGDLIVITPVLRALKEKFPNAELDVLVQPSMIAVLEGNPNVSSILPYSDADLKNTKGVASDLRGKYDLGIMLNYGSYNISKILRDADIPYRIGSTKAGFLVGRGFFLTRKTKPFFGIKHKVEHHMDVIRTIGVDTADKHLEVYIPKEAYRSIDRLLLANKITKKDLLVVIHAMPQHYSHRWVDDRFAFVADALVEKYNAKVVFSGAEKDKKVIEHIQSLMKNSSVNAAGKMSIKEYFALISRANLLISVDTSAMHVGSAVNTVTIALFGAGNPKMWRPYGDRHIVIYKEKEVCTGCLRHKCLFRNYECMGAITVDDVLDAVRISLDKENILYKKNVGGAYACKKIS